MSSTPDWSGLAWLMGRWIGDGGGGQTGTGSFSFAPDAGGQVIVRRNEAVYHAQGGAAPERHQDLMVIYHAGPAVRAIYWDSEGHVIHYGLVEADAAQVAFVSDDAEGPRFRLTYRRTPAGLEGRFDTAPPDHRDSFSNYLAWTARRAP